MDRSSKLLSGFTEEEFFRLGQEAFIRHVKDEFYADAVDSYHDLPLLAAVGHPVAVQPDRRLRKVARFEGWLILYRR